LKSKVVFSSKHYLFIIVVIGFIISTFKLNKQSIWLDEQLTVQEVHGIAYLQFGTQFTNTQIQEFNNLSEVINSVKRVLGNTLLYDVLLHFWVNLLGNDDYFLRLFSVVFYLGLIILGYLFSNYLFNDKRLALITAIFFMGHPFLLNFAREARAYEMGTFLSLLSSIYFFRFIINEKEFKNYRIILYSLFSISALFTTYLTATVFIAQGVIFLIENPKKKIWYSYATAWSFILIVFFMWVFGPGYEGFKTMNGYEKAFGIKAANYSDFENPRFIPVTLKNLVTCYFQVLLVEFGNSMQYIGFKIRHIAAFMIFPAVLFIYFLKENCGNFSKEKRILFYLLIFPVCHLVFSTFLAFKNGHCIAFQGLYSIFFVPYVILFITFLFYFILFKNRTLAIICLVPISLIMFLSWSHPLLGFHMYLPQKIENPYMFSAKKITSKYEQGDLVIFNNWWDARLVNIYYGSCDTIRQVVDENIKDVILIRKKSGNEVVVFDFKNGLYRY
jgi:uncharacterized membrane protein